MYPRAFAYHRAGSLEEAVSLLSQLGAESRVLAGGQSLIPLMKLRFASPSDLIDLNFIPDGSFIREEGSHVRLGPLTRHAQIEASEIARKIPILHDCAAGIADVQVRNQGTLVGSLAEADPAGDWGPVLLTLGADVVAIGPSGQRSIALDRFFSDAYTTALAHDELIREVFIPAPPAGSGGAYVAVKRCAAVYASASAAAQITMRDQICAGAAIALGAVGLTPLRVIEAEAALRGRKVEENAIAAAAEAAMAAADPQADRRGSAAYKKALVGALVKETIRIALRRSRGERVEVSHHYA